MKILFLFIDGVGMRHAATDNPVNPEVCPTLCRLIAEHAKPIDACLGVAGPPQSATGQATMIVNRIKAAGEIPSDLNGLAATRTQLDVCAAETMPLPALLYQGGYLTLSEVIDDNTFRLGIPNNAIANSLSEGYVSSLLDAGLSDWTEQLVEARAGLRAKGVESLLRKNLKAAFAAVPHEWKIENEKEAKRYFLLFMKLIGADISGERQSARGRADAILKDTSGVYVFEFKYDKTPREALDQARGKDYAGP